MKELYENNQIDEYNIKGAKVINIAKSTLDERKVIVLERDDGTKFHIESPKGTKLTIAQQFEYIQ